MTQTLFENAFQHVRTGNARTYKASTGGALVEIGGQGFRVLCVIYQQLLFISVKHFCSMGYCWLPDVPIKVHNY